MKLYEFTDKLCAMGAIETNKLNESFDDWAEELDYYAEKVSDDLYKYEGNKEFDKYIDKVLSDAGVSNIGDLDINDLKKISNYADSLNESSATVEESYHSDDFRDLCREYSSLYPYDISLREVWNEIVRNYEDEDLANDVVDYLEDSFGDEEEYDLYESHNTRANISLVQNLFDEAINKGLFEEAKKIVEDRDIEVTSDGLKVTPTSACTGAYIDLKKLLYK